MPGRPDATDAGDGGAQAASAEFELALREATAGTHGDGLGPRSALIPGLRRALRGRVGRREFDEGLRRLRDGAIVALEPHAHPRYLSPSEIEDALQDGPVLPYLLRWLT